MKNRQRHILFALTSIYIIGLIGIAFSPIFKNTEPKSEAIFYADTHKNKQEFYLDGSQTIPSAQIKLNQSVDQFNDHFKGLIQPDHLTSNKNKSWRSLNQQPNYLLAESKFKLLYPFHHFW